MVSVKSRIGKTPFLRTLRFTTRTAHVSRLTKPRKASFFEFPTEVSEQLGIQIKDAKASGSKPKMLKKWQTMQSVLNLFQRYHGKRPTTSQVMAALAMKYSLSGEVLEPRLAALTAVDIRARKIGKPLFADNNKAIANVAKKDALAKITTALSTAKSPVSTNQLAKRTGINRATVNRALVVLARMSMTTQLPKSAGQKTSQYSWIASEKRLSPETKPVSNTSYGVLLALQQGPKSMMQLFSPAELFGKTIGTGTLNRHQLRSSIPLLEKQGLIECKTKKVPTANHRIRFYSLTEFGKRIVKEQKSRASIHPQLRKILVGQPLIGLMPQHMRRVQKIIQTISIISEYKKTPRKKYVQRGTLRQIMKKYGLSLSQVQRTLNLEKAPWKPVSFEDLRHVYLPAMYKLGPIEARWFEKYLKSHEAELKHVKRKPKQFVTPMEIFENNKRIAFWAANNFWNKHASQFEKAGMTKEDVVQEALFELQKAAETRDESRGALSTATKKYVDNRLSGILRNLNAQKRRVRPLSLDKIAGKRGEPMAFSLDGRKSSFSPDPEIRKALLGIVNSLEATKNDRYRAIAYFGLRTKKPKTLEQVAKKEGISIAAVGYSIQRVVQELRKHPKIKQFEGIL